MEDFYENLTINISGKTHYAIIAFLKKHGSDSHNVSQFIEDAIIWRLLDREMAFLHAQPGETVEIFARPEHEEVVRA